MFNKILASMVFFCSGTLSYIFNNFVGRRTFSEVVAEAKQAGFTEPDPRDDLSGTDVCRKVMCANFLSINCLGLYCGSV
jgi:homoserine dehydrogenase